MIIPDEQLPTTNTCQDQGKVDCITGGCADTIEECGKIYEGYDKDIGYTPEGEFISQDTETTYDDALYDVYLAINEGDDASGWTGLDFKDWAEKYGDTFPQWEGSQYEKQSELLEAQLGLLEPELELKEEAFDLQRETSRYGTTSTLEDTTFAREALMRAGGGLHTGQMEAKIDTTYDRILQGFDYAQEGIDMEHENSLIDFEKRRLVGEYDLSKVVSDFQDNMWSLIATNKPLQERACPEGQSMDADGECSTTVTPPPPELTCEEEGLVTCADGECVAKAEDCISGKEFQKEITFGEEDKINLTQHCYPDSSGQIQCIDKQPWMDMSGLWDTTEEEDTDEVDPDAWMDDLTVEEKSTDEFANAMIGYCSETHGETSVWNQNKGICEQDPFLAGEGWDLNLTPEDYNTAKEYGKFNPDGSFTCSGNITAAACMAINEFIFDGGEAGITMGEFAYQSLDMILKSILGHSDPCYWQGDFPCKSAKCTETTDADGCRQCDCPEGETGSPTGVCTRTCSGDTPYQCADCGCVANKADCGVSGDYPNPFNI